MEKSNDVKLLFANAIEASIVANFKKQLLANMDKQFELQLGHDCNTPNSQRVLIENRDQLALDPEQAK